MFPVLAEALVPLLLLTATVWLVRHEAHYGFGNPDTVVYSIAANLWSKGEVPYRDIVDQKPPAIYLFYRVCFFLGGHWPRSFWQGFTWATGIAGIFMYGGLRLVRRPVAAVATAVAFVLFLWTDAPGFGVDARANTESLAVSWAAVSFSFLLCYQRFRRKVWAVLGGGAFGIAVLSKQPAALWIVPLSLHVLAGQRGLPLWRAVRGALSGFLSLGLGAGAVFGVCLGYFAYHGALREFFDWTWTRNLHYAAISAGHAPVHWFVFVEGSRQLLQCLLRPEAIPFAAGLFALPIALVWRRTWLEASGALWCLSSMAAFSLATRFDSHYFMFMHLALAISFGCIIDWLGGRVRLGRVEQSKTVLAVLAGVVLIFGWQITALYQKGAARLPAPESLVRSSPDYKMAQRIRGQALPGERLLAFGNPLSVLFYADMLAASKYIFWPTESLRPDPEEFMQHVRAARPPFAYIGQDTGRPLTEEEGGVYAALARYLRDEYVLWFDEGFGRVYRARNRQVVE